MRNGLDIIRELVEIGGIAQALETDAAMERWLLRFASLCADAERYVDVVDGKTNPKRGGFK